jgi:phosphoglycerol transferase
VKAISTKNEYIKSIVLYPLAIVLSLLILSLVIKLWQADLAVPFVYGADAVFSSALIKGIIDNGWILHNSFLGAPFASSMYDFPTSDNVIIFVLVKFISLFTSNFAIILNLVYILTYILTPVTTLYVLRKFGVSKINSLIFGLLYTFLSYHLYRGEGHFFLSIYFQVPLIIMVTLQLHSDDDFLLNKSSSQEFKKIILNKKSIIAVLICLLVSGTGVYYAFFGCFFLLLAGISASLAKKKATILFSSMLLVAVIVFGLLINYSPNFALWNQYGVNAEVKHKNPVQSEIYGLKITQLLLPVSGHHINYLANNKAKYNTYAPLVNENDSVSLGIVGSVGFVFLIAYKLFVRVKDPKYELYKILSNLNLAGVLLATIGGFGTLFALIFLPEIRAYNRIVVYIAFFSLFTFALLIDEATKRFDFVKKYKYLKYLLL